MRAIDKISIAFGLACLAYGLSGCSAANFETRPPTDGAQRWGDLRSGSQLGDDLVADAAPAERVACAGRPDEAACYRSAYRSAMERARVLAAQPFASEAYVAPFVLDETPAPNSPAKAEQIREGAALGDLHDAEEMLIEMVQP